MSTPASEARTIRHRQKAIDDGRGTPDDDQGAACCVVTPWRDAADPWPPGSITWKVRAVALDGLDAPGATLTATVAGHSFYSSNLGNGTPPDPFLANGNPGTGDPGDPTVRTYLLATNCGGAWCHEYWDR